MVGTIGLGQQADRAHRTLLCQPRGRRDGVAGVLDRPEDETDIEALIRRLVSDAREEIVFVVPDHRPGSAEFSTKVAELALGRGAALRSVWSPEVLDAGSAVDHAEWLRLRWAAPRTVPTVPRRVVLVDNRVGVVFDEVGGPRVVRDEPSVARLIRMVDRLWLASQEIPARAEDTEDGGPRRQEVVLRLLAVGLTDDAVARRLGISVRTVRNDVASSMSVLDARSRFQAGVRAAQLGLI